MLRRDHLNLVPMPRYPVLRHVHMCCDGEPMMQFNMALPPIRIGQAEQRLDRFIHIDDRGVRRDWYTARRCECGFLPYTAPVKVRPPARDDGVELDALFRLVLAEARQGTAPSPAGLPPRDAQTP